MAQTLLSSLQSLCSPGEQGKCKRACFKLETVQQGRCQVGRVWVEE